MECYYHPDRDGTDTCAICGKSICKECGLELAGKIYCKECLEKIVGLGAENKAAQVAQNEAVQEPVRTEPARLDKQPAEESVYQTQNVAEEVPPAPEVHEIKQIRDDSPYNIKDNIEYSGGIETSYEKEPVQPQVEQRPISQEPQIAQTEIPQQAPSEQAEFIYPDHSYDPQPTSARMDLEDRYEKYLDDLYFDDNVPLGEQLAKDEEQYGSLTRKEYPEREETLLKDQKRAPKNETPEEMEARIRAELLAEKEGGKKGKDNIHNLNYQEEKEPMGVVDILLTILLVIIILVVIYYLIYIFILHATYPTFMEAIYALSNPQNVINNILSPPPSV
ncbi:hypothetical protein [uncultured Methanobrevibacter sp.]|uniref:hypothetical protein n=1 Tax=uncultured Methanobrevibacter sp. TaxID=253161 RepID=UPI0025F6886D|nr:hypothetical protein [uncultured Methanobrevibacter sp.]